MVGKIFFVGDEGGSDETQRYFEDSQEAHFLTYQQLMRGSTPIASDVPVLVGFPYSFWEEMVETPDVLYGDKKYGEGIRRLAHRVEDVVGVAFPKARFVNHPNSIITERDKLMAKNLVASSGVPVPETVEASVDAILDTLSKGNAVYVKARYGAMGKGITYLSPRLWTTNYRYENGVISNNADDHSWGEIDVTGDVDFLRRILDLDVVVEKAIQNPKTNGWKFDLRCPVIYCVARPDHAYARTTHHGSITNISQGGTGLSFSQLSEFVPAEQLKRALGIAEGAAITLGLNNAGGDLLFEGATFEPVFLEMNSFPGIKFNGPQQLDALCERIIEIENGERTPDQSREEADRQAS